MSIDFQSIIKEVLATEKQEADRTGDETTSKPREPATAEDIAKAEVARGRSFSDAYKSFLHACNGWEDFSWSIQLFGTKELEGEDYDEAEETLGYTEDIPKELEAALIIGANEDDATTILLLDTGEVVDHLYEETERFPDLGAYLRSRKTTLLEGQERALAAQARTEREWAPEFRKREDEQLTAALHKHIAASVLELPLPVDPYAFSYNDFPTKATELVLLDEDNEVAVSLELGLVLYLGAAPTKKETLATFRAFRRAFRFPGPMSWSLADAMVFSFEESDDPDAEPFADKLRVDDQGFFGLRVSADDYVLNVRSIPPDARDEEEEAEEEEGSFRRASFVEILVPSSADPEKLRKLCHELADFLPIRSGHGGYFARVHDDDVEPDPWNTVFEWCRRYFAIEPCYLDGWLGGALTRHRGAGWLTVLGRPFVDALGPLSLSSAITQRKCKQALVLTAGELTLGDIALEGFPTAIAEVARVIAPVSLTSWARAGTLHMCGNWFSTFETQLPGAFGHHHATESFVRRYLDPKAFVGLSAREHGLILMERLRKSMDSSTLKKWKKLSDLDDVEYFKDLLSALFSGSFFASDEVFKVEVLEHIVQFPGWAPAPAYNNLLVTYFDADRIDDGMALLDVALETAEQASNSYTFHTAASYLVKVGQKDRAMKCVVRAKELEYPMLDKLIVDEDLLALHERDDWQALFG